MNFKDNNEEVFKTLAIKKCMESNEEYIKMNPAIKESIKRLETKIVKKFPESFFSK